MAYCDLYEYFKDDKYLDLARRSADWMLTFRKSYKVIVHPLTIMGAYDMSSKGGDFASVSNNHLHVFEMMVAPHLFKLADWTGDDYYRQRALDHWDFCVQYLCRVDGQFNGFRGACPEQYYWANWMSADQDTSALEADGFTSTWNPSVHHCSKGHFDGFSVLWCVNIIILGARTMLALTGQR